MNHKIFNSQSARNLDANSIILGTSLLVMPPPSTVFASLVPSSYVVSLLVQQLPILLRIFNYISEQTIIA